MPTVSLDEFEGEMISPVRAAHGSRRWPVVIAILLALVPTAVKLLCYPHNIGADDAYIHLQVARNVVSGHGWGLNPGTPVNLSSSPAFTLLLVAVSSVTTHVIGVVQMLSCVAGGFGLLLIFWTIRADTGSAVAGLVAEGAASLSCDLWRWNGTVMEAGFAFFVVALLLFLFRGRMLARWQAFLFGMVAGVGVLLRPELLVAVVLCAFVAALWCSREWKFGFFAIVLSGAGVSLAPWLVFSRVTFGRYLPTTFYAKSLHGVLLWNSLIAKQIAELVGESFLWPAVLSAVVVGVLYLRRGAVPWRRFVLPVGLLLSVVGFYYLKTPGLESPGRYVLPLLPCAAVILGLVFFEATRVMPYQRWIVVAVVAGVLQGMTSLAINEIYLVPTLNQFEEQYGATMRAAAEFVAGRVRSSDVGVLVENDVGVLAYTANGRFHVWDGGGLASPELVGLSIPEQIRLVHPAYVVESQGLRAEEWERQDDGRLGTVWMRRYRQHGLAADAPYFFVNVYSNSVFVPLP